MIWNIVLMWIHQSKEQSKDWNKKPTLYNQLILSTSAKNTQQEEEASSGSGAGKLDVHHRRETSQGSQLWHQLKTTLNATRMEKNFWIKLKSTRRQIECIKVFLSLGASPFLSNLRKPLRVSQSFLSLCQNVLWSHFLCFTEWSPSQITSPGCPPFT